MLFGCAGPLAEATERSSTLAAHCDSFRRRTNSGRTPQERRDLALHLLFKTEVRFNSSARKGAAFSSPPQTPPPNPMPPEILGRTCESRPASRCS